MKPGSVIVDLAAQQGGNCELTRPDEKSVAHDVSIIGYTDLPSRLPTQSSNLYANNIVNLLTDMTPEKDGKLTVDLEDVVVRHATVTHQNEVLFPAPKIETPAPKPSKPTAPASTDTAAAATDKPISQTKHWIWTAVVAVAATLLLWILGKYAPPEFVGHLTVFVLACFVGWQLVWNVTPALHTPLMSVTNAISGIIVVGGILQIGSPLTMTKWLAALAVLVSTINIAGGFLVTHRMLSMFRKQA